MYCCLHDRVVGTLASLLYVVIHCSPAPVLVHKLVGLLESIEKLPIYLYESSTSYSLQVCIINEHHLLMCVYACACMCGDVCHCMYVHVCICGCVHTCVCACLSLCVFLCVTVYVCLL